MPPSVPPRPEMGGTTTAIWNEGGGHLRDPHAEQGGLHHYFARKLHALCIEIHLLVSFPAEASKTAVEVPAGTPEQDPADGCEYGIAEVSVGGRHCPWGNEAFETVAHDQVVTLSEFLEKRPELRKS